MAKFKDIRQGITVKYSSEPSMTITMSGTPEQFIHTMKSYLNDEEILNNDLRRKDFFQAILAYAKNPKGWSEDLYV